MLVVYVTQWSFTEQITDKLNIYCYRYAFNIADFTFMCL